MPGDPTFTRTATASPTPTVTNTPEPTPEAINRFFLPYHFGEGPFTYQTANASVEVDAAGGIHVTYEPFGWTEDAPEPVYYAYCSGPECDSRADFIAVALEGGDAFSDYANLAIDPNTGQPRLLWTVPGGFRYAECNAGDCTERANWTVSPDLIGQLDGTTDGSHEMFAVDGDGQPRFVFNDTSTGAHGGTYYMACDNLCTEAANWQEVRLTAAQLEHPSFALTSAGLPRFAFQRTVVAGRTDIGYGECNAECDTASNWNIIPSFQFEPPFQGEVVHSLAVDVQDRPHLAVTGLVSAQGEPSVGQTLYGSCDMSCGEQSWGLFKALSLTGDTYRAVSLALDGEGRPRIGYEGADGIYYAWCNLDCETAEGADGWDDQPVEPAQELDESLPGDTPSECEKPNWTLGHHIALTLDADGAPYMAYDAHTVCAESWARFARFDQP